MRNTHQQPLTATQTRRIIGAGSLEGEILDQQPYYVITDAAPPPYTMTAQQLQPTRTGVQLLNLTGGRVVIAGTLDEIREQIAVYRHAGRLVDVGDPVPDGQPGRYAVTVRLAPPVQPHAAAARPAPGPYWTLPRLITAAVALVLLGALVWAVIALLAWVAANMAIVIAVLVLIGAVAVIAGPKVCETVVTVTHRH
jgi:hypothetical protein